MYASSLPSSFHTGTSDYAPTNLQLIFQSQQPVPACVNITILDDDVLEDIEEFTVVLSSNDSAVVITRNTTTIFIPNADSMCTHTHTLHTDARPA